MYQTGKGLTALILGPKGDKLLDFKNDAYDDVARFIWVLEMLVLLMPGRVPPKYRGVVKGETDHDISILVVSK